MMQVLLLSADINAANTVALTETAAVRKWLTPAHSAHAELLLSEQDATAAYCRIFTGKTLEAFLQIRKKKKKKEELEAHHTYQYIPGP